MTKKKVACEVCGPTMAPPHTPRLYLSLEGQDVAQIKGLKVGDKVELLVTGKVMGLSQRERNDYEDSKKVVKTGDIDLEGYRVRVLEDEEQNEYEKMAAEDD